MDIARDIAIFNRIKDDYIRDARAHKVSGDTLLDWLKEHLTEEEYNSAGDLGFSSREEELAFAREANHVVRKNQTVQTFMKTLNRIGSRLDDDGSREFMHAIGTALADDAADVPDTPDGLIDALREL